MKKLSILIFSLVISYSTICQEAFAPINFDGITPKWTYLFVDSSRIVTELTEGTEILGNSEVFLVGDSIAYFVFYDRADRYSGVFLEKLDLNTGQLIWNKKFDVRETGFHEFPAYFGIMEDGLIELVSYKIAQDLHPIFGWNRGHFLRREIDSESGKQLNISFNEDYGEDEILFIFGWTRMLRNEDDFIYYHPKFHVDEINDEENLYIINEFKIFSNEAAYLFSDSVFLPTNGGFLWSNLYSSSDEFVNLRFSGSNINELDDPREFDPDLTLVILDFFDSELQHSYEVDITEYLPAKWHSTIWDTYDDLILIKSQDSTYLEFYDIVPTVHYSVFDKFGNHISDIDLGKEIVPNINSPVHIPNTNEFLFFQLINPTASNKGIKVWHLDENGETNLLRTLDFYDDRRIDLSFNMKSLDNGDVLFFYSGNTREGNNSTNLHNTVMRISAEDLGLTTSVITHPRQDRQDLKAFPNPTTGPLTLEIPDGFTKGTLEVVDMSAGTVHRQKIDHPQEQFSLDIGHLPAGVYHIELYPEENAERVFYGTQVLIIDN